MSYITIDCGTTNSRAYLVTQDGAVLDRKTAHVGVRNTSMDGNNARLASTLRELIAALRESHPEAEPIEAILSSGMITSEIGLRELAHLTAPCGLEELSESLTKVDGLALTEEEVPVYFVRGIKNSSPEDMSDPFTVVTELDFMRGEEAQVMGLLQNGAIQPPTTVLVLSSHSKFIPIDGKNRIIGSLTTASGQAYAAILENTFVGKSVREGPDDPAPEGYLDLHVVEKAMEAVAEGGLLRCLMYPRFLDVLLESKWYERKLFFEAAIAADDIRGIRKLARYGQETTARICLIGQPERCALYRHVLTKEFPDSNITCISSTKEIDQLSIDGVLAIFRNANQK